MRQAYVYLAGLTLLLVTLQFLLAGIGIFGAGSLEAHRAVGFALHLPPLLMIVAAAAGKLGRPPLIAAVVLLVAIVVQSALPNAPDVIAAFHPLVALVIFVGAAQTFQRARAATSSTADRSFLAVDS
jgi:hypothetical protein